MTARPLPGPVGLGLGLGLGLAGLAACEFDPDSVGGPPMLGDTTMGSGSASASGTADGMVDDGSDTGPYTEGPRRRRLDIDGMFANTNVGSSTLLVVLDDTRIEYEDAQPDGSDLRFFGPDMQAYPLQIERWDPTGRSYVWVYLQAATLPDHLWMWYGDPEGFASIDPAQVWDSDFAAIWHMDSTNMDLLDTTAAGHALEPFDFAGTLDEPGHIGLSTLMNPSPVPSENGPWDLESPDQLSLSEAITVEAWVSPTVATDSARHVVLRKMGPYELRVLNQMSALPAFTVRTQNSNQAEVLAQGTAPVGEWTYLVATYDSINGVVALYRNGILEGNDTIAGEPGQRALAQSDTIVQVGHSMQGYVDELRVSSIARSNSWITLQYASMSDALFTFGPPQPRE